MKKAAIIISCVLAVSCVGALTAQHFIRPYALAKETLAATSLPPAAQSPAASDRIHFLNTGSSDAFLLESDGHFAMVDSGEDTDNPRGFPGLELPGFEQEVLSYLKKHAAGADGKVHLDFILGTHSHSDHIGGFDTIIMDPDVTIDRAILKKYDSSKIRESEIIEWDNQEVYDQMVQALQVRKIPVVEPASSPTFTLGNFKITLFNTVDPVQKKPVGENDQSLGVLVEKNGTRVFLSGDLDNKTGDEHRLAGEIGKVNLLKVGHHCYAESSSSTFIKTLHPDICVIPNQKFGADKSVLARIIRLCHPDVYVTGNEDGVLAVLGDQGNITCYGAIYDEAFQ